MSIVISQRDQSAERIARSTYQILALSLCHTVEVEHEELKTIAVALRHSSKCPAKVRTTLSFVNDSYDRSASAQSCATWRCTYKLTQVLGRICQR